MQGERSPYLDLHAGSFCERVLSFPPPPAPAPGTSSLEGHVCRCDGCRARQKRAPVAETTAEVALRTSQRDSDPLSAAQVFASPRLAALAPQETLMARMSRCRLGSCHQHSAASQHLDVQGNARSVAALGAAGV